jgi:hypothetical protein
LTRVQRIRNPRRKNGTGETTGCITAFIPVIDAHKARLPVDLQALMNPLPTVPEGTHFARWCVIAKLELPKKYDDDTSYLVFSAWFDGQPREYLEALYKQLGQARATQIWRNCGFGGGDAQAFANYMLRYRVNPGSAFAAYDRVTVEEVLAALHLWERFHGFAVTAQTGSRVTSLKQTWMSDPVLRG